jgi:hypothetical protein
MGGGDSGEGVLEVGPNQVGELGEKVGKRWAVGIWAGWRDQGEFWRGNVAAGSVSRGGRRGQQARGRGLGRFYSSALLHRREGEEKWSWDRAQDGRRRRRFPRMRGSCSASAARRGKARGGQRRQHGRWEEGWGDAWMGGAKLQELRKRPAVAGHARAQRQRSSGTRGRRWRT